MDNKPLNTLSNNIVVRHSKYGLGVVESITGNIAIVLFEDIGRKRFPVISNFLERIEDNKKGTLKRKIYLSNYHKKAEVKTSASPNQTHHVNEQPKSENARPKITTCCFCEKPIKSTSQHRKICDEFDFYLKWYKPKEVPYVDAMFHRLPGSFESGKKR